MARAETGLCTDRVETLCKCFQVAHDDDLAAHYSIQACIFWPRGVGPWEADSESIFTQGYFCGGGLAGRRIGGTGQTKLRQVPFLVDGYCAAMKKNSCGFKTVGFGVSVAGQLAQAGIGFWDPFAISHFLVWDPFTATVARAVATSKVISARNSLSKVSSDPFPNTKYGEG